MRISSTCYQKVDLQTHDRHNRLYMEARPMEAGLAEAIDDEKIGPGVDPKDRSKILSEVFGWEKDMDKKI